MNYGTMKERVAQVLGRQPVALAFTLAKGTLDSALRILEMEVEAEIAAAGGNLILPDDFIEPQRIVSQSGEHCTPISHEAYASGRFGGSHFVLGNGRALLCPAPADGDLYTVTYFAKLADLIDDADTNAALAGGAQDAFIYAVLSHHSKLIRDATAAQFWQGEADKAILLANRAALQKRFNGGTISVQSAGTVV